EGREMKARSRVRTRERRAQERAVGQVPHHELAPFDRLGIAARQVVIDDRCEAGPAQGLAGVAADVAGAAGDQNGGRFGCAHFAQDVSRARRMLWATRSQSPRAGWRKSRAVGYHGLSSRPSSQRQSGTNGTMIQTNLPSAPARWAVAVSAEITRSSADIAAAVSAKSVSPGARSVIVPAGSRATSAARSPTWSEKQPGARASSSGARRPRAIERCRAVLGCRLPAPAR